MFYSTGISHAMNRNKNKQDVQHRQVLYSEKDSRKKDLVQQRDFLCKEKQSRIKDVVPHRDFLCNEKERSIKICSTVISPALRSNQEYSTETSSAMKRNEK